MRTKEETQSYLILTLIVLVLVSARQLVRQTPHVRGSSGDQQREKDQESVTRGRILSLLDV